MKKIFSKKQLESLNLYDKAIVGAIAEVITILDQNYGENRNVDLDIGGYVLILENNSDVEAVKKGLLEGLEPEYTDTIQDYTSSLYLISSDIAVVVIATLELSKILLE